MDNLSCGNPITSSTVVRKKQGKPPWLSQNPLAGSAGMGGWHQPESVAGINRNQWLASPGIRSG
jgi:hypothetical protein